MGRRPAKYPGGSFSCGQRQYGGGRTENDAQHHDYATHPDRGCGGFFPCQSGLTESSPARVRAFSTRYSMKVTSLVVAIALGACAGLCNAQPKKTAVSDFFGKWVVTDIVGYGDISGGIPEAKHVLGLVLTISPKGIDFDKDRCTPNGAFSVSEIDSAAKLKEYFNESLVDTGLPARTAMLDSANCIEIFRVDETRLLFGWNGIVVRAVQDK